MEANAARLGFDPEEMHKPILKPVRTMSRAGTTAEAGKRRSRRSDCRPQVAYNLLRDEEALHRKTRAVHGIHLLLHEGERTAAGRGRHAELFPSHAAIGPPDGAHAGGQRLHRADSGPRPVDSSADPTRGAAGIWSRVTRRYSRLRSSSYCLGFWLATYPASSYWLKICQTSARNRGSSLANSGRCSAASAKFDQLLANQVVERALHAEAPLDSFRRLALLDPDLLESDGHSPSIYRRPTADRNRRCRLRPASATTSGRQGCARHTIVRVDTTAGQEPERN